jgi:hypothetical protein
MGGEFVISDQLTHQYWNLNINYQFDEQNLIVDFYSGLDAIIHSEIVQQLHNSR